ncbi:MAG: DUF2167 domain-containing protein [Bacteroidetes bacterium]|nr:DUF2167 domain-containing protein [Bacteroidota bacterium]
MKFFFLFLITVGFFSNLYAQQDSIQILSKPDTSKKIEWIEGPAMVKVGTLGEINLILGEYFANGDDTRKFLTYNENLTSDKEVGMVISDSLGWWTVFEFDGSGYVKDDEKNDLDSTAMMVTMQENQEESNSYRAENGMPKMSILGWAVAPYYNSQTHNLEWAIRGHTEGHESTFINHNVKLLGRYGVMEVTLVTSPENYQRDLPLFREMLTRYEFQSGQKYAEFREGDKIAEYGLTALVLGGAAAVAAKSGFFNVILKSLAAFWKLIVVGVGAAGSAIWKYFSNKKDKE